MKQFTNTKPDSKGARALFAAPASLPAQAREICAAAQEDFNAAQSRRFVPLATSERLHAMLDELAPMALGVAWDSSITLGADEGEEDEKFALVHPVLAHFAFVALALWQSEQCAKSNRQTSAP